MSLFDGHGTGSLPLPYDYRDVLVRKIPDIQDMLCTPGAIPTEADLRNLWKGPALNQGAQPSCVAFSTCQMEMMFQMAEKNEWVPMDGAGLYVANHGDGVHGVGTREVLQYCQEQGAWAVGNQSQRFKISTYAFVHPGMGKDVCIQTMKAAIASGRPIVMAMLLPTDFGANSMSMTTAGLGSYHQFCGAAYNNERVAGPNSWGSGFGGGGPMNLPAGWVSVPWEFLFTAGQQGLFYAYTTEDAPNDGEPPPPPPPKPTKATIAAKLTGEGVGQLAVGQQLGVSGTGFTGQMILGQISIDTDQGPTPGPITVSGYSRSTVRPGDSFQIQGAGFAGGILTVSWGGVVLQSTRISATAINAIAPANTGQNPVQVRVEGAVAEGPILTVSAGDPPPPGELTVTITEPRRIGSTVYAKASATLGGQPVHTIMTAYVDGVPVLMGGRDVAAGSQGFWGARVKANPITFRVDAKADGGQTGSASVSI